MTRGEQDQDSKQRTRECKREVLPLAPICQVPCYYFHYVQMAVMGSPRPVRPVQILLLYTSNRSVSPQIYHLFPFSAALVNTVLNYQQATYIYVNNMAESSLREVHLRNYQHLQSSVGHCTRNVK